jgi:hypothetical protein
MSAGYEVININTPIFWLLFGGHFQLTIGMTWVKKVE